MRRTIVGWTVALALSACAGDGDASAMPFVMDRTGEATALVDGDLLVVDFGSDTPPRRGSISRVGRIHDGEIRFAGTFVLTGDPGLSRFRPVDSGEFAAPDFDTTASVATFRIADLDPGDYILCTARLDAGGDVCAEFTLGEGAG